METATPKKGLHFTLQRITIKKMKQFRYIASCNFTLFYPKWSARIQHHLKSRMDIIRCCTDKYRVKDFEDMMAPAVADQWKQTTHYKAFDADTCMVSVCHNCTAVFQEQHPGIKVISLWEYILNYVEDFPYPDFGGVEMSLQDCWRQYDNAAEQAAVRQLLRKMNIRPVELAQHHADTRYCGLSTLRPAPRRNLALAPERFVKNAAGIFTPHSPEEHKAYMEAYCKQIKTEAVVAYCHYCTQGFQLVGQPNYHLCELLFKNI